MRTTSRRRILALGGAVLLLAVITAGCAGRSTPGVSATTARVASLAVDTAAPTGAAATPVATPGPTPPGTPLASPDLSAIDGLIKNIDNELGADASAGADEGTMP